MKFGGRVFFFGKVGGFGLIVKPGATIILSHHDRKEERVLEMFF